MSVRVGSRMLTVCVLHGFRHDGQRQQRESFERDPNLRGLAGSIVHGQNTVVSGVACLLVRVVSTNERYRSLSQLCSWDHRLNAQARFYGR